MGIYRQICKRTFAMAVLAVVVGFANAADESGGQSLFEWNFTDGDDGGWRNGWSKTPDTSIDSEFDVLNGLGLQLTFDFHESQWGDSNIKAPWPVGQQAPGAVNLRILAPVSGGKPKGPMQLGCAMNVPTWTEAGQWIDLKFPETVTISGVEYRAQSVTCELGTSLSAPVPHDLVLRFGGDAVRYKGVLYIQQIRGLRIPGAPAIGRPAVSTPVRTAPVDKAPVVVAPVRTAPVVKAPVVVAPARTAPVVKAPVVAAPREKSRSRTSQNHSAPVRSEPVVVEPVVATPAVDAPDSKAPEGDAPGNKSKPVFVEPVRVEPVRAQRNVD